MTAARKTNRPSKNPRRQMRRKKNMSTGAKIAIAAAVVLVGVPVVMITAGALGFRALVKKAEKDMPKLDMQPMSGTQGDFEWTIEKNGSSYHWLVYQTSFGAPSLNASPHGGDEPTYTAARSAIDMDIMLR